jgi:transposase
MARKPEIFLRELDPDEAQKLVRIARTSKDRVRLRRAGMALASLQGRSVPEIATMFAAKEQTVRELIKTFNDRGFAALDPKARRGSTRRIGPPVREQIARIAKCDPARLDCPFTVWSLTKLRDYLAERKCIQVSRETIRLVLKDAGISFQNTKTWKHSTDPEFAAKLQRILDLYHHAPHGGRVICVDEFGPLNLMPRPGKGWYPTKKPKRLRATFHRTSGVRHMFAALDLASGEMFYRIRDRKRWIEFLDFLRQLRRRFPHGRLHVVLDNFSPHNKTQVRDWCAANDVELVFTPTNASWLNWIECEFTALRYFALDGSDYPDHKTQETAIGRYVRWRNKYSKPKTNFAIGSKIREPDYLPLSA